MTISHPMYAPATAAEAAIEAGAVALWGARAIDHSGTLDLPHDRMDAVGDRKHLKQFKVRTLLDDVERSYRKLSEGETVVVQSYLMDRAQLVARKSGGYVYMLLAVYR